MEKTNDKHKKFLEAITKIKRIGHHGWQCKKVSNGEIFMLRAIKHCIDKLSEEHKNLLGVKTSELSKLLMTTKPATSKMVNNLEEKGYVERITDKEDRRVVYLNLTKEGKDILDEVDNEFKNFTQKIVEEMGEEDTDTMIRLFNKLYDIVSKMK